MIVTQGVLDGETMLYRVDVSPRTEAHDMAMCDWIYDRTSHRLYVKAVGGLNTRIRPIGGNWGEFSAATAPAQDLAAGDLGYCTDGKAGAPCAAYYDGAAWRCASTDAALSAS